MLLCVLRCFSTHARPESGAAAMSLPSRICDGRILAARAHQLPFQSVPGALQCHEDVPISQVRNFHGICVGRYHAVSANAVGLSIFNLRHCCIRRYILAITPRLAARPFRLHPPGLPCTRRGKRAWGRARRAPTRRPKLDNLPRGACPVLRLQRHASPTCGVLSRTAPRLHVPGGPRMRPVRCTTCCPNAPELRARAWRDPATRQLRRTCSLFNLGAGTVPVATLTAPTGLAVRAPNSEH